MTRTFTPEELTAHLTDEQRRIIREGTEALVRNLYPERDAA